MSNAFNLFWTSTPPQIALPLNVTSTDTTVHVNVDLFSPGIVACAAFVQGTPLLSVAAVTQRGQSASLVESGRHQFVLSNLIPSTQYDVFCFSQNFGTALMNLEDVKATKTTIPTLCCQSLQFTAFPPTIVEYSAGNNGTEPVFVVSLENLDKMVYNVSLAISPLGCREDEFATVLPSHVELGRWASVYSASFLVHGSPGCYLVTAVDDSGKVGKATSPLEIMGLRDMPPPIYLRSAQYSSNGASIVFLMSGPTDQGGLVGGMTFSCAKILNFNGVGDWSCVWLSNAQILATIVRASPSNMLPVGSTMSLLNGEVKPLCPDALVCVSSNLSTTFLLAPKSPVRPILVITVAENVSMCDDIQLDVTFSYGQGLFRVFFCEPHT